MPHNSCTVILNGHGSYNKSYIYDLSLTNINYNVIFLDEINKPVSNAQHNLLLKALSKNVTLTDLELLPTTYVSEKSKPKEQNSAIINMNKKAIPYIYEHCLSNAPDVKDVNSLVDIDNQRFLSQNKILIDYGVRTSWRNNTNNAEGSFTIQYDVEQIKRDVLQAYQGNVGTTIDLSSDNLLYITPVATQGSTMKVELYSLLTDILHKIKIPILYHPVQYPQGQVIPASVDVGTTIFLDDDTLLNRAQVLFPNMVLGDVYHEVVIAGDANIIWDACRTPEIC